MEERDLKPETQHMVNSYFDYIENEKGGLDDIKLLNKFLAENMKDDVTLYLTHRVILSCKIFRGTEAGFLRSVMLVLVQHFYTRDEEVVVQGEPADGMSFIAAASVPVLYLAIGPRVGCWTDASVTITSFCGACPALFRIVSHAS